MNETDDRLVGDPVWELFAYPAPGPAQPASRIRRYGPWLIVAGLIALGWFLFPPLAVVTAGLSVAARDFRRGRQLARSIPSKAGGTICAVQLCLGGLEARNGRLRVDVGLRIPLRARDETARNALGGPGLDVSGHGGFHFVGGVDSFGPGSGLPIGNARLDRRGGESGQDAPDGHVDRGICLRGSRSDEPLALRRFPRAIDAQPAALPDFLAFCSCLFVGPLLIVLVLDRISRRIIADRPGKFGPKVPTVGKWNS